MIDDVDEYYDSILAYVRVFETDEGTLVQSIRDLSGRWQRALNVGVPVDFPDDAIVQPLPRAVARFRR